nr:uncharacterized protein LOC112936414 [Oryza sativa Japonica Group]
MLQSLLLNWAEVLCNHPRSSLYGCAKFTNYSAHLPVSRYLEISKLTSEDEGSSNLPEQIDSGTGYHNTRCKMHSCIQINFFGWDTRKRGQTERDGQPPAQ